MTKLFFLLSGENETLPASELAAILETEGYTFELVEKLDQTVRLQTDPNSVKAIQRRSAYTRICALELFTCEAKEAAIMKMAASGQFENVLNEGETFAVRVRRVRTYAEKISTVQLEGKLGKHILQNTVRTRVNLKTPEKTFIGVLTNEKLVFGVKLAEIAPKPFVERRPRKKPFFHPSAMPSKLARCMVNLAHAKTSELVLDPFCGTGSVMIEAAFVGCRVLGLDVQRRMTRGSRKNLKHFNVDPDGLVVADARVPPITKVDCLVTDPPYGRSATTMKSTTRQIVEAVLFASKGMLREGQRICIALPIKVNGDHIEQLSKEIAEFANGLDFRCLESHKVYVHRTLTREILVYEKRHGLRAVNRF